MENAESLKVDFHSHTSESDGSLSPQQLADFMAQRGVQTFAISDHDTLSAYGAFTPAPGTRIVTGIEINTTYRDNEVHILGYGFRLDAPQIAGMVAKNQAERVKRAERMVSQLRQAGYGITIESVLRESGGAKSLGRPHIAKTLITAGMAPDIEWTFRNLLRRGKPGYVPSIHVTPYEAIERIHASGGVAALAHPGRLRDRSLIDELVRGGLDGLEVFYPLHDADDIRIFRTIAEKHGLFMTAGSDFHDIRYHARGVGMDVATQDIAAFLERIAA